MNKAGGRVKAQATINGKWFRQIPKNWQRRCARIFASAKPKAARRSQPMALTKRVTSPRHRTAKNSRTKVRQNKIPYVERVVSQNVLSFWYHGRKSNVRNDSSGSRRAVVARVPGVSRRWRIDPSVAGGRSNHDRHSFRQRSSSGLADFRHVFAARGPGYRSRSGEQIFRQRRRM
jgi:hypothetical protein